MFHNPTKFIFGDFFCLDGHPEPKELMLTGISCPSDLENRATAAARPLILILGFCNISIVWKRFLLDFGRSRLLSWH